jgi:predicted nuclease of predicted toxin-antitoxin system
MRKILIDNNLSHRLIGRLQNWLVEFDHVVNHDLDESEDTIIWAFAKKNDYVILTKDTDFHFLLTLYGAPPKVIRLNIGNASNKDIIAAIEKHKTLIEMFVRTDKTSLLEL